MGAGTVLFSQLISATLGFSFYSNPGIKSLPLQSGKIC